MAAPGGEKEDVRGKTSPEPGKLEFSLDVPFPTAGEAEVALRSLSPDREPRKGGISKRLSLSGSTLSVRWSADEARVLRVSVNSFLDHLSLVVETMQMFGPPVSQ
ncbi:L antigen family member 3-like [Limanda limanda]|uniref:L antigen family member 3-like n=1 Tax=Limanda limanda TaxID=27771 RepID=UPI0029C814B2|nr:L antigen family member 3-like [Limanda limanda]